MNIDRLPKDEALSHVAEIVSDQSELISELQQQRLVLWIAFATALIILLI